MTEKSKWIMIPIILSFIISAFYVFVIPGEIKGDAKEYNGLANSILKGEYSLNGAVSMEREPGYPLFRASVKLLNPNTNLILFFQLVIFCLTIYIIGLISLEIDPKIGLWGLWGASLSYGLAFYSSAHITEVFTAFLLALIGLSLIRGMTNPATKYWVYSAIFCSFIVLTRYPYILIPVAFLILMTISSYINKIEKNIIIKNILISVVIMMTLVSPWLIRNYIIFREINIAGRSGAGLYARAWKADKPWKSISDSYLSALVGRGILYTVYPSNQSIWLDQWGDWWRDPEKVKLWGKDAVEIDRNRKKAAFEIIFKDFNNFSKFAVWSGVDTLRLLQIQNPTPQAHGSSFEGTYGPIAKEGKINKIQLVGLGIVHLAQIIWFVAIAISLYLGFKKYRFRFLPGVFLICILIVHSIADDTPRYGAPIQPWLLSAIFMTIVFPIYTKFRSKILSI